MSAKIQHCHQPQTRIHLQQSLNPMGLNTESDEESIEEDEEEYESIEDDSSNEEEEEDSEEETANLLLQTFTSQQYD